MRAEGGPQKKEGGTYEAKAEDKAKAYAKKSVTKVTAVKGEAIKKVPIKKVGEKAEDDLKGAMKKSGEDMDTGMYYGSEGSHIFSTSALFFSALYPSL